MDNDMTCAFVWAIIVTLAFVVQQTCLWRERRRQRQREALRREAAAEVQRAWGRRLADALQATQIVRALGPTVPAADDRKRGR